MGFSGLCRSATSWSQSPAFCSRLHASLSEGGLAVISGVLKYVPNCLPRPDGFAGLGSLTSFLKTPTYLAETIAILGNPFEHLLHNSRLFGNGLEPSLTSAVVDADVSISKRSARHDVQRTALGRVLLTSTAALHDFGSLVLGYDPLHLKQQVVFGALAELP